MNQIINALSVEDAVKQINAARLANKGKWVFIELFLGGKIILIKTFDTSIQRFIIDNINYGGQTDLSVGEWKKKIADTLTENVMSE